MIQKFIRAQQIAYRTMARFSGAMILVAAIMACVNVICRKCFNTSLPWTEELCTYICTLVVFLTFAWLETEDQQLCIDLVTATVKNKTVLLALYVLRGIVTLVVTALLIRYGVASIATAFQLGTCTYVMKIPRYAMYCVVVFGYICVMLGWLSVIFLNKGRKFSDGNDS